MSLMDRDLLPNPKNVELRTGTLYAELVRETVLGKLLFAIDIMHVPSGPEYYLFTAKQSWRTIRMRVSKPFLDHRQHLRLPHILQYWETIAFVCFNIGYKYIRLICWILLHHLVVSLMPGFGFLSFITVLVASHFLAIHFSNASIFQRRLLRVASALQHLDQEPILRFSMLRLGFWIWVIVNYIEPALRTRLSIFLRSSGYGNDQE